MIKNKIDVYLSYLLVKKEKKRIKKYYFVRGSIRETRIKATKLNLV
jgi:hypothetical protein